MEYPRTTKNVGQPCVICGQPADAQATVEALQAAANYYKQPSKNGGVYSVSGGHIGNLMDWCKDNLAHCKFSGPDEDNLDLDLVQTAQQIPQLKTELSALQGLVRELQRERDAAVHDREIYQKLYGNSCMDRGVLRNANDELQAALDAEREKVKELVANQAEYEKCTDEQITALNQGCLDYEKQIATLQAQLAEIEQILCIESGKTTVDKVRDLHHSFKQVWNSYQSAVNELFDAQAQLAASQELAAQRFMEIRKLTKDCVEHSEDWTRSQMKVNELKAQLRQVEGERDRLKGDMKERFKTIDQLDNDLTTLRQLVEALPVLDMRFDSVAVGLLGWTVGGVTFGKVTEANAYSALLQYRATLAAQDAGEAEDQRHIDACCGTPNDCKWGGLGGCGYEGRKYELKQDAVKENTNGL